MAVSTGREATRGRLLKRRTKDSTSGDKASDTSHASVSVELADPLPPVVEPIVVVEEITGATITERAWARVDAITELIQTLRQVRRNDPVSDKPIPLVSRNGTLKTRQMMLIELEWDLPIEDLLVGSLSQIAKRLDIDNSTVSKWKTRLQVK